MLLRHPFFRFCVYLTAGVVVSGWWQTSIAPIAISVCILVLSVVLVKARALKPVFKETIIALFLVLSGCLLRYYHTETIDDNHLTNQNWRVDAYRAEVTNIPEEKPKTYRIEVKISAVRTGNRWQPASGRVNLSVAKDAEKLFFGDHIVVLGVPSPTEAPKNAGEFDYQRYLSFKNIYLQHYLKKSDFAVESSDGLSALARIYQVSSWASGVFRQSVKSDTEYGVIKAMVLGQRDNIDQQLTNAYAAAGAIHVLSVSGFHIAIFFAILSYLLGFIKKFRNGIWVFTTTMLAIIWVYAVLTGLSPAVMRSAGMFSVYLLAGALVRKPDSVHSLLVSYFVLVCYDPFFIYSVGFQLSYAAILGILLLQPPIYQLVSFRHTLANQLWGVSVAAISATLATFPLCLYYFHQFPNYFLLANPFVVLLSSVLLGLSLFFLAVSWIPVVGGFAGFILEGVCWLLNQSVLFTEALPYSVTKAAAIGFGEMLLIYAIVSCIIITIYYRKIASLGFALALAAIWLVHNFWNANFEARQHKLAVHSLPNQTAITLCDGHSSVILADSAVLTSTKAIDFYVKNYLDINAIYHRRAHNLAQNAASNFTLRRTPFGSVVVWQNKKILVVAQPIRYFPALAGQFDWVIFTRKSVQNLGELSGRFGTATLVFDGSIPNYLLNPLFEQAQRNKLPYIFVKKMGAYVVSW